MRETIKKYQKYFITTAVIVTIIVVAIVLFIFYRGSSGSASDTAALGAAISAVIGAVAASVGAIVAALIVSRQAKMASERFELSNRKSQEQVEAIARLTQEKFDLQKQQFDLEKQKQMLNRLLEAVNLSEEDPRLAIVIAFQGLETEIDRAISPLLPPDVKTDEIPTKESSGTFFYKMSLLTKYLGPEQINALLNLYDLRNRIVHGEVGPQEVSQDKAKDYVQQVIGLARSLSSIEA